MDTSFLRNITVLIFRVEYREDWGSTFLPSTGSHCQTPWHHSPVDHYINHHCHVNLKSVIHVRYLVLVSWRLLSSGFSCHVVWETVTNASEEPASSTFRCHALRLPYSGKGARTLLSWLPKQHHKIYEMRTMYIMNINIKDNYDANIVINSTEESPILRN